MPGHSNHPGYCPAGLRYIPDSQGYTCTGGAHRITFADEFIDEQEVEFRRLRERRRRMQEEWDRERAIDDQRRTQQARAERRRLLQEEEDRQRVNDDQRAEQQAREEETDREEREREKAREKEREDQKQKDDFEEQRQEALARVRATLDAPLAIASMQSRTETIVQEESPASPMDELDENPFTYPWVNPAEPAAPAANQREPEPVSARRPRT